LRAGIYDTNTGEKSRESVMPFYTMESMMESKGEANAAIDIRSVVGEFMKVAFMTEPEGEGPPLHEHPNEEQFSLVLEGEMHFILGDEDRIVGPGTLIHIPRNVPHRSRPVNGPATFFTVKCPPGDGRLDQDYRLAANAAEAEENYPRRPDR
jgi:quercetin dioxygenase-like cupin family protein